MHWGTVLVEAGMTRMQGRTLLLGVEEARARGKMLLFNRRRTRIHGKTPLLEAGGMARLGEGQCDWRARAEGRH